jgi:hypothetical protein
MATERFREHGISYVVASQSKGELYASLLAMINSRRVELLDHPRLVAQLCGLERRTAWGGRDAIDHSPGAHDDVANAVAGAVGYGTGDRARDPPAGSGSAGGD